MAADQQLIDKIRTGLAAAGCPDKAGPQQRYMKSALPYYGLTMAELRRVVRPLLAPLPPATRVDWGGPARALWDEVTHRDEWYAALQLAGHRRYQAYQDPASMALYEHLIVTGAWWDVVDEVAANRVGHILRAYPDSEQPRLRAWSQDDHLWKRRTAILAQLRFAEATDRALLTDVIEANLEGSRYGHEFFIRKAIGWALRQYARTDPAWMRSFVAGHADRLAGLSRREALKHRCSADLR